MKYKTDKFSRREITEAEIAEMLPGYEQHESGLGHYFDSPNGRVWVVGANAGDQVFGSEVFGMINVSRILENFITDGVQTVTVNLDQGIKDHIAKVEINPEWVRKVSAPRLREPIVMIVAHDGMNVLDGHHRLARHILNKSKNFPAYIVPPEGLEYFQVRHFVAASNGNWRLAAGAEPAAIDRMIAVAKQKWTPQNIVRR